MNSNLKICLMFSKFPLSLSNNVQSKVTISNNEFYVACVVNQRGHFLCMHVIPYVQLTKTEGSPRAQTLNTSQFANVN